MTTPISRAEEEPFVTVVIPCRNEVRYIRNFLASLLASSYARDRLEVVVVDGMSTDGTRAILEDAVRGRDSIRILDNPLLITPVALNLGILAARGEIIVRMDARSVYPQDYIARCVRLLMSSGPKAGNVGGRILPLLTGASPWARAVEFVTMHRFGVGAPAYKTRLRPGYVDTVPFGTFWRAVLNKVGPYDVRLTRNQDIELNARLQRAGYAIVYDPTIQIRYPNKADLPSLLRPAFFTGMWNVYTLLLHPYTWKSRHFVPMFFVGYLAALAAAESLGARGAALAAAPLGLYAVLVAAFSLASGGTAGRRLRVAATFASYHLTYGAGSFFGIFNVLTGRWREYLGRPLPANFPL